MIAADLRLRHQNPSQFEPTKYITYDLQGPEKEADIRIGIASAALEFHRIRSLHPVQTAAGNQACGSPAVPRLLDCVTDGKDEGRSLPAGSDPRSIIGGTGWRIWYSRLFLSRGSGSMKPPLFWNDGLRRVIMESLRTTQTPSIRFIVVDEEVLLNLG